MNVLIFLDEKQLKPIGGPLGYNYSLKMGLREINNSEFKFLSLPDKPKVSDKTLFRYMRKIKRHYTMLSPYPMDYCDINTYDAIHFNSTLELYKARNLLERYSGKVILTSHSPQLLSEEIAERVSPALRKMMFYSYGRLKIMDEYAFNRADYIIFPCEEAEQPYESWEVYIEAKKKGKIKHLLTGTQDCLERLNSQRTDFRSKYSIPKDAFVISYVGRHNAVKGYEDLKKFGKVVLNKYENVYFLIGGKEEPMKGLNNSRWIEVGWTTEAQALIHQSDVFILPNRETYFDLVMLEVLSLGVPIIASYTGGNRYFDNSSYTGIALYKNEGEFFELIDREKKERFLDGMANRKLYESQFTTSVFANNYVDIMHRIIN